MLLESIVAVNDQIFHKFILGESIQAFHHGEINSETSSRCNLQPPFRATYGHIRELVASYLMIFVVVSQTILDPVPRIHEIPDLCRAGTLCGRRKIMINLLLSI